MISYHRQISEYRDENYSHWFTIPETTVTSSVHDVTVPKNFEAHSISCTLFEAPERKMSTYLSDIKIKLLLGKDILSHEARNFIELLDNEDRSVEFLNFLEEHISKQMLRDNLLFFNELFEKDNYYFLKLLNDDYIFRFPKSTLDFLSRYELVYPNINRVMKKRQRKYYLFSELWWDRDSDHKKEREYKEGKFKKLCSEFEDLEI